VSVDINNESGIAVGEDAIRELAQYVIDQMETHPLADLSMLLVDEAHMTNLHEKWMEEPGPTDVLSFPMDELRPHSIAGPNRTRGRDEDESEPVLRRGALSPGGCRPGEAAWPFHAGGA
jgi:probable rRNA maturation factor